MKRNFSLLVVLVLNCSVGFVLPRCENFLVALPETVVIPEGGGTDLFCEYSNPEDIQRRVDWYRGNTVIRDDDMQDTCDCTAIGTAPSSRNITFSNFRSQTSAGTYGCWAALGGGFAECNFEVVVAVAPMIMLDESGISGNILGDVLTITPTIDFGLPEATVTWTHNGEALEPSDPRVTISEGILRVTGVQASDRGVYRVTATNSATNSVNSVDGMASVNVPINFLEVSGPTFIFFDNGAFEVNCVATGYPSSVTATLTPIEGMMRSTNNPNTFEIVSTVNLTIPTCNSATSYICMATTGSGQTTSSSAMPVCPIGPVPSPLPPPTGVEANTIANSFTQARVMWRAPVGVSGIGGYRVRYNSEMMDNSGMMDFIGTQTTVTLEGLISGVEYSISVATIRSADETNVIFSETETFTIPCLNILPLELKVPGVRAILDNVNGQRTVTINWTASTEVGVMQYSVRVRSSSVDFMENIDDVRMLRYTMPPEFCNGNTYEFSVTAVDACGRPGPVGDSASLFCSSDSSLPVLFSIPGTGRTDNSLQLMISRPLSSEIFPSQPLFINVTNINRINGTHTTLRYILTSLPSNRTICVGDLRLGTFYNICLSTGSTPVGMEVCRQESTINRVSMERCLMPSTREVIDEAPSPTGGFPDWAIAVIVVGVFGLLAVVFCFIGLCFACSTNNKDYDASSVSSLQTASIPPGPSPYITTHRNNPSSPHRSCLSYHKQGHSTNWNEHRDTLRQMDTVGGTHV